MPHEMPVMAIMAIVEAEHAPVIHPADQMPADQMPADQMIADQMIADQMIDVREIVLRHLSISRLPHFFPQFGSTSGPFQDDRIVDDFFRDDFFGMTFIRYRRLPAFFATSLSLTQEGHVMTLLLGGQPANMLRQARETRGCLQRRYAYLKVNIADKFYALLARLDDS
jgi:hypothetical protein